MGVAWDGGKGGTAGDGGKGGSGGVGGGGVAVGRGGGGDFSEGSGGGISFSAASVSLGDRRSSTTATGFESFVPVGFDSLTGTGCLLSEFSSALVFVSAGALGSAFVYSKFTNSVSEDDFSDLTVLRTFLGSVPDSLSSAKLFSFLDRKTGEPFASFPSTLAAAAAAAARSFFFLLSSAPRLEFSGSLVGEILEWRLRDPDLCFLL